MREIKIWINWMFDVDNKKKISKKNPIICFRTFSSLFNEIGKMKKKLFDKFSAQTIQKEKKKLIKFSFPC